MIQINIKKYMGKIFTNGNNKVRKTPPHPSYMIQYIIKGKTTNFSFDDEIKNASDLAWKNMT
jgi:hypothetical protein